MNPIGGINKTQTGFTLIELLLYVAMVGLAVSAISLFLTTLLQVRTKTQNVSEVELQGAQVMRTITQSIRNSASVNAPAPAQTAGMLSVEMSDSALSPTIFGQDGTTLTMQEGSGNPISLTNGRVSVTGLSFKNIARPGTPDIIQVSFSLNIGSGTSQQEFAYQRIFIGSAELRK